MADTVLFAVVGEIRHLPQLIAQTSDFFFTQESNLLGSMFGELGRADFVEAEVTGEHREMFGDNLRVAIVNRVVSVGVHP